MFVKVETVFLEHFTFASSVSVLLKTHSSFTVIPFVQTLNS